jgi:hypothetical protein
MRNFIRTYIQAGNYLEDTAGDLNDEQFMAGFEVNNIVHENKYTHENDGTYFMFTIY